MTKIYKILWIDDEYEQLGLFLQEASSYDILLVGFKSYEEAFENFESKIFEYDAIVLDAKFFNTKNQVKGSEDLKGLAASKDKIAEFRKQRNIPYFILSGQTKLENNNTFSETYGEHYRKQNPDDIMRLFADIKIASDKQAITQVKHRYHNVFEVCTDKYIGHELTKPLLDALLFVENVTESNSTEDLFNPIRKIIEKLFTTFNKLGLLPDKIYKGKGWINQSSVFLSGKHPEYRMNSEILEPVIAHHLKNILQVIQDASHIEGELRLKVDQHVRQSGKPFLYKSVVFQLLDVLSWFKKYADKNPDKEKNKALWLPLEEISGDWKDGIVINLNKTKGFAFFKPNIGTSNTIIPPAIVSENGLADNNRVSVVIEEYEDNKNKEIKTRVKHLKIIK